MQQCYFCQNNIEEIDFKDSGVLLRFMSERYKIKSRKKTGLCARHQKRLATAVKRARYMALIPYTNL
jgi:small subunit ribosomal protein S18